MPLTRAQYLQGDSSKGTILSGEVQGVKPGSGVVISPDGTISFLAETSSGVVKTNNVSAFNGYVWPSQSGQKGTFLGVSPNGGLEWLPPPGLVALGDAPLSPRLGQLWFDYDTNLTYVYQNKGGKNSWYPGYRGLEPIASLCVSYPAFSSGSGSEGDPFTIPAESSRSGNTILFPEVITISGLAPFQFVPIVDINSDGNEFRFQPTNTFADSGGKLEFKVRYTDYPQTAPGVAYTAKFRVGFDLPFFIQAAIGVTVPLEIQDPGSITGVPEIGQVLNYEQGLAIGGSPPYSYSWKWKTESGGQTLQTYGNTYVVGTNAYNDRVYVELIATDSSLDRDSAKTSSFPLSPGVIAKSPFPLTNILFPDTLTGTASTIWADAGTSLRAEGCIEISTDGISFGQSSTIIANGGTLFTRWIDSPSCAGAGNGDNISGCVFSSAYEECGTFRIDRIPSPFSFLAVSEVTPNTVATSLAIVPVGYNATGYITYNGSSTGSNIEASLNGGSSWTSVPLIGSASLPINPGDSLRVRMTVGADFSTSYTGSINIGQGNSVQTSTFTATTKLPTSFTTAIKFPSITTAEVSSPPWADGSTSISATGCIQFKVGTGGTWYGSGDPPVPIANGNILYTRWNGGTPGVCGQAPHGTNIVGTITNVPSGGTRTSTASLTVDRVPGSFSFTNLSDKDVSSVIESNALNITGTNAPAFLTLDGASTLTSIQARIGGGSWVTIPSSGETLSIAPVESGLGTSLQIRGTTGTNQNQTYTAVVKAGQSSSVQSSSWGVTTTSLVPGIVTPSITSPVDALNGAGNVNPNSSSPAGVTITSSAYTSINGAGAQVSSDWEIYYLSGGSPVYIVQSNNNTVSLQSYFVPLNLLGSATVYYARVRYRTNSPTPIVSNWSYASQFTILTPSIATPSIVSPVNGSTNLNPYWFATPGISLTGSAYSSPSGAGPFGSSEWEVRRDSTSGTTIANPTSSTRDYFLSANLLSSAVTYFARCRYNSSDATPVVSSWSPWISFQISPNFNLLSWQQTSAPPQGNVLENARRPQGITTYTSGSSTYTVAFYGNPNQTSGNITSSFNQTYPLEATQIAVPLPVVSGYATGAPAGAPLVNMLVAVGGLSSAVFSSESSLWRQCPQFPPGGSSAQATSVAFGDGTFVVVTSRDIIYTSTDPRPGGSWSLRQPPLPPTTDPQGYIFTSVVWDPSNNKFSATCYTTDNGVIKCYIFASADGVTWTRTLALTGSYILKLACIPSLGGSNGGYLALASNGVLYGDGLASWALTPGLPSGFSGNGDISVGGNFTVLTTREKCFSARRGVWPPVFAEMVNPFSSDSRNFRSLDGPTAGGAPIPYFLTSRSNSFTSLFGGITYRSNISSPPPFFNNSFYTLLQ